ncbi:hypothetical protein DLAC_04956 [Tieghemostelium lacteum]|uniref:Uncharacterized protein n=1 Tax=Tieghemostelium lacteum TaxID=361077 RepID=A0A151ZHZ0_TIELA|nr:hypothetical protein DLAC_04956 [Tieghemostelium lacteum]|eukprot:KYQ93583.1 hypothetical protein DLAC_04956 [Tieghemostelium lacteum]
MIQLPVYVVKLIISNLSSNQEICNLISICKSYYAYRKNVTFLEFPLNYLYEIDCNEKKKLTPSGKPLLERLFGKLQKKSKEVEDRDNQSCEKLEFGWFLPLCFTKITVNQTLYVFFYDVVFANLKNLSIGTIEILSDSKENFVNPWFYPRQWTGITKMVLGGDIQGEKSPYYPRSTGKDWYSLDDTIQFPSTLISLFLGYNIRYRLKEGMLPSSLENLEILYDFCYLGFEWDKIIPSGLQHLRVGLLCCQIVPTITDNTQNQCVLPKSLKYLNLGSYNGPLVVGSIPDTVETLVLGDQITLDINVIPKSVKKLRLPEDCISLAYGILPETLEHLDAIGYTLNENDYLPPHLKSLRIYKFKDGIPTELPKHLKILELSQCNQPFEQGMLPNTLKTLIIYVWFIDESYKQKDIGYLPNGLEILRLLQFNLPISVGQLPSTIQFMELGNPGFRSTIENGSLPSSLTDLIIPGSVPIVRGLLSDLTNLVNLEITDRINRVFEPGSLPVSLKKLRIRDICEQEFEPGCLNEGLEVLQIDFGIFKFNLETILPKTSLKVLKLGYYFKDTIKPGDLPNTIKDLELGNLLIKEGSLHEGLEILRLGVRMNRQLTRKQLPSTLKKLYINTKTQKQIDDLKLPPTCKLYLYTNDPLNYGSYL